MTISRIDLLEVRRPGAGLLDLDVAVTCSSGTYIRAIARDLGAALRTGGHLTALRRTRVGPYLVAAARTLDQLAEQLQMTPLEEAAAAAFDCLRLSAEETRLVSHGGRLPVSGDSSHQVNGAPVAAFDPDGNLTALLIRQDDEMRPLAVFVP